MAKAKPYQKDTISAAEALENGATSYLPVDYRAGATAALKSRSVKLSDLKSYTSNGLLPGVSIQGTDNASADAAALAVATSALLAQGGGTIYFDGTMNLGSIGILRLGSSTVPLSLVGLSSRSTIRFDGSGANALYWGHWGWIFPSDNKIDGVVVERDGGTLANYRWNQFTTYDHAQLSVGDWIYVWSEDEDDDLKDLCEVQFSPQHHHPGEFVQIKAKSGSTITLEDAVQYRCSTLWIHKRDVCRGPLRIGNFAVICDTPSAAALWNFRSVTDLTVDGVDFRGLSGSGFALTGCANAQVRNIRHDGTTEALHNASVYAVSVIASRNVTVEDVVTRNMRHHFDTGAVAAVGNGTRIGTNRGLVVRNWRATQTTQYAGSAAILHTHEGGYETVFETCSVDSSVLAESNYVAYGYQARAHATKFINNRFNGLATNGLAFLIAAADCEVTGNNISNAWRGIWCTADGIRNGDRCAIAANEFKNVAAPVQLQADDARISAHYFPPTAPIVATGHYPVPITSRSGFGGHRIHGNTFDRGAGEHGAIWQEVTGAIDELSGNTFVGWDSGETEGPALLVGPYGSLQTDGDLLADAQGRNFGLGMLLR